MTVLTTNGKFENVVQLITVIFIFVIVLALTYFATKYVGNYQKNRMTGNNIQILETIKISNSKYLQIIQIGNTCFVIAVCKDTITYLCNLNAEDLVFKNISDEKKSENFKAIIEKFKKEFKKDKPED